MNVIPEWADAFGSQIAQGTTTDAEIASHYIYNPERWRVFVDGTRQFIQYGDVDQYTHNNSEHEIQPNAGETVVFETAERFRYTVQFELAATWAAAINQELQDGDRLRIGLFDDSDGWFIEHNDTHGVQEADLVVRSGGSESQRLENQDIHAPITTLARFLLETGWYRVTRQRWERSYPRDGEQKNPEIGTTGDTSVDGPEVGNFPLRYEVTAGSGTSNLTLRAGSTALVTYGDQSGRFREKTHSFEYSISSTDTWVPISALRIDPEREITSVQLQNTDIVAFSGSGDVRVMPIAVDPTKTDAGSWQTPIEHSDRNSVIEIAGTRTTPDVTTFPDNTGTVGTSADNPGGYQLGYGSWYTSGTGSKSSVSSGATTRKREVTGGDVCVFLANASTTGDMTVEVISEQDF